MEFYEIAVDGERTVKFPSRVPQPGTSTQREQKHLQQNDVATAADEDSAVPQQLGGIIKRGTWGWLTSGNALEIIALRTGQTIATYDFTETRGYDNCCIRCVEELFPQNTETVLLAVCLECFRAAGGGCTFVAIYSIEHSQVLSCMELPVHVTAAAFVSGNCCRRSLLQNFDGCLAVGSEEGVILLLDLNISKILLAYEERTCTSSDQLTDGITLCQIADYNLPLAEIHRNFRQTRQDGLHFGLQVEVIDTPCSVQCLLPIDLALGLAIGLEDGRLAFYDLAELQIIHIATPQTQQAMAPVVKLSYLEPLDDPRHCLYVWAVHENGENLSAVLHTLIYEKRLTEKDDFYYFESFLRSTVRLQIPLEATKSVAIGCQSVNKIQHNNFNNNSSLNSTPNNNATHSDEDGYCLTAFTWYSALDEKNKLLIFDLNQWYKEEMPYGIMQNKCPSYLAGYVLSGRQCALNAYLNPNTVAHFNSLQRCEEHFYPNSLSFDCVLLLANGTLGYTWIGAQNKIINVLRASNSSIFLEPDMYFREILRTRLLPQFSELNVDSTFSRLAIFETILSVALEHNCFSLLRDCAKCWADGSFMGSNITASTGISLSTLTDWIWKRATDIKTRCNDLSKCLFDYDGYPLDQREQKELGFLTRQLKLLGDLLSEVLSTGKRYIPDKVFLNLATQHKSIRMASEYQDVLLWLLNIGLLPEMQRKHHNNYSPYNLNYTKDAGKSDSNTIQYPYKDLKDLYERKRKFFACINEILISKKTGSCRLLFIDALIAHECKGDSLRECWLENGGNGLYPPPSIEAMLRVMLVPEMEFESKCAILLYFFLDLHMTIDEQAHKEIVESFVKFPSVFKLTATLIKTVQSLWNLDHGLFMPAVDEFISPFNNNQTYPQWMVELLIESLLTQNAASYALRILEARPNLISPILKLNTLLANDLTSEAFHFARTKYDDTLLECFFNICLCTGKYGVIRDLALTEREGQLVQHILRQSKTHGAENLHFVYLLQKSKYIEAVSYLDELSRTKSMRGANYGQHESSSSVVGNADTPNLVLSAFNTTMAPVTQGLTDVYFRIKNKIKKKEADNRSPVPLSCQLIKQNANNLLGGIYHSSALSAHFATCYWGEMDYDGERKRNTTSNAGVNLLLSANNAPFLRKPQVEACHFQLVQYAPTDVSYPQPYRATEKRTLTASELEQDEVVSAVADAAAITLNTNAQPRKRRRLLGQEIVADLGHFIQTNKSARELTAHGFDLQPAKAAEEQASTQEKTTSIANNEYLIQPLTTPRQRAVATFDERRVDERSTALKSVRATSELHSILKTSNTPDRNERAHSLRREVHTTYDIENKNLRFKLPATEIVEERRDINKRESPEKVQASNLEAQAIRGRRRMVTTTTCVDETELPDDITETPKLSAVTTAPQELLHEDMDILEDDIVDEVVIEVHHEHTTAANRTPIKRREVIGTYAGESRKSAEKEQRQKEQQLVEEEKQQEVVDDNEDHKAQEDDEDEEEEEENFYSPLSSRNNSLIAENIRSPTAPQQTKISSSSTTHQTATAKIFRFSGPQPRKPLARLSAERSQSRTPEKELCVQMKEENIKETANEQRQTTPPAPPPPQSDIENQPSSGYVSVSSSTHTLTATAASRSVAVTVASKPAFEIKSVISLASSDFMPRSSSSKLYATQTKMGFDEIKMPASHAGKLAECSTMVGSFSVDENEMLDGNDETDKMAKDIKSYTQLKTLTTPSTRARQPLHADTTLGMSSYEFTLPQVKSQITMQTTSSEMVNQNKQKAALLTAMETVEFLDMDNEMEVEKESENENENDEKQQTQNAAVTNAETDLFTEALGITVQQAEYGNEVEVGGNDSNDMVALYESRRAEIEKRNEQAAAAAAANDSNDSSVIILSSSESSPHMSADNQTYDSDADDGQDDDEYAEDEEDENEDEDGDEAENEDEDEDEDVDEAEDYAANWDEETNENTSSSSIEVINEGKSSSSGGQTEEVASVSNVGTSESEEGRETDSFACTEDEQEKRDEKKTGEPTIATKDNTFQPQSESKNTSQSAYAESVESENGIIVVEAASSSCADCEELIMHEIVDFVKSEDEQQTDNEEHSFYSSRSVFMQNNAEITIEELKVSTYKIRSKEVYEELSGDVFYCDAEASNQSSVVEENKKPEFEIIADVASTSFKARQLKVAESVKLNVEETSGNKNTKSGETQSDKGRSSPSANTVVVSNADGAEKTEKDSTSSEIAKVEKDTEAEKQKETEVIEKPNVADEMRKPTQTAEAIEADEEEEEIKLHVDQADLSEIEEINSPAGVTGNLMETDNVEQVTVSETTQATNESPEKSTQPEHHQTNETPKKKKENKSTADPVEKSIGSPKTPTTLEVKSQKRTRATLSAQSKEKEAETFAFTPRRYSHRGTSVPPPIDTHTVHNPIGEVVAPPHRNKRGISVPPQTRAQQEHETVGSTPETRASGRRSIRASSAQPSDEIGTPRTRRSIRGVSMPHESDEKTGTPVRSGRGTSVPPAAVAAAKIVTRRRSALLDAINESTPPIVDSPSARTRSRMRLNSAESDLDASIVGSSEPAPQTKRTRRTSMSSNVSEQPTTPSGRRTRRTSVNSATAETNSDAGTPRTLRRTTRRRESIDATQTMDEQSEHAHDSEAKETKTNVNTAESALYSSARRLTRTQLAMMEKSAALIKNPNIDVLQNTTTSLLSPTSKRLSKRRNSRSTVHDSDDVESVSSRMSNASGAPKVRRVTRSSVKDKEENDDDLVSVASSVGSERLLKRRSKESKDSPNTTLSTIQEDEAEEPSQNKRSRSKRLS